MHYQRQRRSGSTESRQPKDLGGATQVTFRLPDDLHKKVVTLAKEGATSIGTVLRRAVEVYIGALKDSRK